MTAGTRVAVIGDFVFEPRYQGVGSSSVNAISVENVVEKISDTDLMVVGMERGYRRDGKADYNLEAQALELASKAEVILYFLGLGETEESEGLDRKNFEIPQNQISLLQKLTEKIRQSSLYSAREALSTSDGK